MPFTTWTTRTYRSTLLGKTTPSRGPSRTEELLGPLNPQERMYAPKALFVEGHSEWLRRSPKVAVVGARKASEAGRKRAAKLARLLVSTDATVVSGLAEGIDAAAHTAAIAAGGRTIAVIGTELAKAYPATHRPLRTEIARDHLVVSQFPPGYPTTRRNFPLRNRTMALICDASVIVEAGDGSGSLSQGWEALRLGRPLFLMASVLEVPGLAWPAKMIEYGAMVLKHPDDLLSLLPEQVDDPFAIFA